MIVLSIQTEVGELLKSNVGSGSISKSNSNTSKSHSPTLKAVTFIRTVPLDLSPGPGVNVGVWLSTGSEKVPSPPTVSQLNDATFSPTTWSEVNV